MINYISPCDDVRKECEKWYHFTELFYKGTSKEIKNECACDVNNGFKKEPNININMCVCQENIKKK